MRSNFETGPLYPFCVVPVGDPTKFRVENLQTSELFGTHEKIVDAYDEAEKLAVERRKPRPAATLPGTI